MPMNTTFVIGVVGELARREHDLPQDLGGREVAVEALMAGRAERAVERAARLRRDAERAAGRLAE